MRARKKRKAQIKRQKGPNKGPIRLERWIWDNYKELSPKRLLYYRGDKPKRNLKPSEKVNFWRARVYFSFGDLTLTSIYNNVVKLHRSCINNDSTTFTRVLRTLMKYRKSIKYGYFRRFDVSYIRLLRKVIKTELNKAAYYVTAARPSFINCKGRLRVIFRNTAMTSSGSKGAP